MAESQFVPGGQFLPRFGYGGGPVADAFPVGAVYLSIDSTNPGTTLGYGTWAQIAQGRALFGQDGADVDFDAAEKTGGAKTHALTVAEMPAHTHIQDAHNHIQNAHSHAQRAPTSASGGALKVTPDTNASGDQAAGSTTDPATATNQAATATNQNAGGGGAHSILNPYFVVYAWKRTA